MNKLRPHAFGTALGIISVLVLTFFFALFLYFPQIAFFIAAFFAPGRVGILLKSFSWSNVILSLVLTFIFAYVLGFLFALLYNLFLKAAPQNEQNTSTDTNKNNFSNPA